MQLLEKQKMNLLKEKLTQRVKNNKPLALVRTYGCQQNVADGEKIKGLLECLGFDFTNNPETADLIMFNTCAVRENAEDRIFGNVGALKKLKKQNKNLIIALCGCMMEQTHIVEKIRKSFPFVDIIFGTQDLSCLPNLLFDNINNNKKVSAMGLNSLSIVENLPIKHEDTTKVFVPIMYGCNNFCSYCIVPYVRGRERSRKSEDILREIKNLVANGYKEITLLGQNVNSYGKNLEEKIDFAELLRKICSIDGNFLIRFMTSHPKDITKELIDVIAENGKIAPHLHLPVQSGSDRILKQMNRHYDRKKYLDIINYAKSKIKDLILTSDIIIGFPSETLEDFEQTLDLIKQVEYLYLFTFIYSKRKGTPAAKMPDPIPYEEKSKWFRSLLKEQNKISEKLLKKMIGKEMEVLVENESKTAGSLSARTKNNIVVEIQAEQDLIGHFAKVEIIDSTNIILKGKLI